MTWKFFQTVTGKTAVNIANLDYNEMLIIVHGNNDRTVSYLAPIPKISLNSNILGVRGGYYVSAQNFGFFRMDITSSEIKLNTCIAGTADVSNNTTYDIYYR